MLVYWDRNLDQTDDVVRDHPWTTSDANDAFRFHDFRKQPGLIRTVLEDFVPFSNQAATGRFFRLVEWLNGPDSVLETNDSAFRGPRPNDNAQFDAKLKCSGRLMLFFRRLEQNLDETAVESLAEQMAQGILQVDSWFVLGAIGFSRLPTRFVELPVDASGDEESRIGQILMVSFWAYGNTDAEVFENLLRVVVNLTVAVRTTAKRTAAELK